MWHGPARDFAVQFPYERFWPDACVLYRRLEHRNQAYPGKVPREGIKALRRGLGYFMRDVPLTPPMTNRGQRTPCSVTYAGHHADPPGDTWSDQLRLQPCW